MLLQSELTFPNEGQRQGQQEEPSRLLDLRSSNPSSQQQDRDGSDEVQVRQGAPAEDGGEVDNDDG